MSWSSEFELDLRFRNKLGPQDTCHMNCIGFDYPNPSRSLTMLCFNNVMCMSPVGEVITFHQNQELPSRFSG